MKKLFLFFILINAVFPGFAQTANKKDSTDLRWLQSWFDAWQLVSADILKLPEADPPEMVFFDQNFVITTSDITAPDGVPVSGPSFFGKKLNWRKAAHSGEFTLPDRNKVVVKLMSFAAPAANGNSFFVMAAPSFWELAGVNSAELGLEKLLTGVFLHEFAHTRQFNGFGMLVDSIDKKHHFTGVELSDDIIQDYFRNDTNYIKHFRLEVSKFYDAAFEKSDKKAKDLIAEGLMLMEDRHWKYFTREKEVLQELDRLFLSMEGIGQYVGVAWLTHPKGGNLSPDIAVKGFRRRKNQWSQEEGLALFLALKRLTDPDWKNTMFNTRPVYITELLRSRVESSGR